jgi:excisionase family DNA binding protein
MAQVTTKVTKNAVSASPDPLPPGPIATGPGAYWVLPDRCAHLSGMDTLPTISPSFLTQKEVAELLRVPERTLEDWRFTQQGPPYLKLGRHVRYELADLLDWARRQRHA